MPVAAAGPQVAVSQCFTLYPGDVISTGTPPGVGIGRKPPVSLRGGETLRCGVPGLGMQQHAVVRAS